MVMGFNSHSVEIPSHFDEDVSFEGNDMLMNTFYLTLRLLGGAVLAPTLVLLARTPVIQRSGSN